MAVVGFISEGKQTSSYIYPSVWNFLSAWSPDSPQTSKSWKSEWW